MFQIQKRTKALLVTVRVRSRMVPVVGRPVCSAEIHSVWNTGDQVSISLHTYGRHINHTGRSEFDPVHSGYGGIFYWGSFGDGAHTFTLYIDGREVESFEFFIAEPPPTENPEDLGFRKGASGEYVIENFLGTDETVTIRWSEANQNFIIVDYN